LAAAVHVARREGLPEPIPVTLRYPGIAASTENEWQEQVVSHLGLKDWEHIEIRGELDYIGEIAQDLFARHGLQYPVNIQTMVPVARIARGGSVLTGFDGDGLFTWRWWQLGDVVARRAKRRSRDLLRVAYAYGPAAVRYARMRRTEAAPLPWLTPAAEKAFLDRWIRAAAQEPARWEPRIRWWSRKRDHWLVRREIDKLGPDHDVVFSHPLLDGRFLAALAQAGGPTGLGDRTRIMQMLFGGLLPDAVITRRTKATFAEPFWAEHTREFTSRWDGEGADPALIDIPKLKEIWRTESPAAARTGNLVRYFWLRSRDPVE
jgi:asparagine synthase (glutamine-hydrolysing)